MLMNDNASVRSLLILRSNAHILPLAILLLHPGILAVHQLVSDLTVRRQQAVIVGPHVDHTHAPINGNNKELEQDSFDRVRVFRPEQSGCR